MEASFQRSEFIDLLRSLNNRNSRGVLVLGGAATGKTVLLQQLQAELQRQGRAAFLISLARIDVDQLSARIMSEIPRIEGVFEVERTIRASGGSSLRQSTVMLNRIAKQLQAPVLMLDGLDESPYPQRVAAAIEELSVVLDGWTLVVSSRPGPGVEARRFARLGVLQLGPLTESDMVALLRQIDASLDNDVLSAIVKLADGNPLIAGMLASSPVAPGEDRGRLESVIESLVNDASTAFPDRDLLDPFMEELALAGGRDRISALAGKMSVPEDQVWELLGYYRGARWLPSISRPRLWRSLISISRRRCYSNRSSCGRSG